MTDDYEVVRNDQGSISIWPTERGNPPAGWTPAGHRGARQTCLDWIEAHAGEEQTTKTTPQAVPSASKVDGPSMVIPFPQARARERLYVFPHAGSGATYYHFLARALSDENREVVLVLYPGRELRMRDDPIEAMPELVALLDEELALDHDGRPYQFFGHSMGALAAFELTHRLREAGRRLPQTLYLSGRQPPHVETNVLRMDGLSDDAFLDAVGHRYGAIPPAILENRDLCALILRSMRADFVLMENYRMTERSPLDVPVVLLNGEKDRWIKRDEVKEWSRYTTSEVTTHFFAGDHFYLAENAGNLKKVVRHAPDS